MTIDDVVYVIDCAKVKEVTHPLLFCKDGGSYGKVCTKIPTRNLCVWIRKLLILPRFRQQTNTNNITIMFSCSKPRSAYMYLILGLGFLFIFFPGP